MLRSLVPLVGHAGQESVQLQGAFHGALQLDADAGVGVVFGTPADPVAGALRQGVPIRPAALELVADAAVEVVLVPGADPEGEQAGGQLVVDELRCSCRKLSQRP